MTEPNDEIAELFAAERSAPGPSDDVRRRLHRKVAATVGIAVVATASAGPSAAAGTGAVATGITGKIVALVLVVGAIGGGAALAIRHGDESRATISSPPPTVPRSVAPPAIVTPIDPPEAHAGSPDTPTRSPSPVAPRRSAKVAPQAVSEGVVLARAWAALGGGKPEVALALVEEDVRMHPSGTLAEERDALRIDALLRLGRADEARRRAARFSVRYPTSVHGEIADRAMTKSTGSGQ